MSATPGGELSAASGNTSFVAGTGLGVDCSLFAEDIARASFGQLVWSAGTVGVLIIATTWCLHN